MKTSIFILALKWDIKIFENECRELYIVFCENVNFKNKEIANEKNIYQRQNDYDYNRSLFSLQQ